MLTIVEHKSASYGPRTFHNAKSADWTVAFAVDFETGGEKLTHRAAGKKYLALPLRRSPIVNARELYKAIYLNKVKTLNVAGNGIYTCAKFGTYQATVNQLVYETLRKVHEHLPIQKIVSGGQTGVDLAGGVAGYKLGIDVEMTLPAGFRQRNERKVEIYQTEADVRRQVIEGAEQLLLMSEDSADRSVVILGGFADKI